MRERERTEGSSGSADSGHWRGIAVSCGGLAVLMMMEKKRQRGLHAI